MDGVMMVKLTAVNPNETPFWWTIPALIFVAPVLWGVLAFLFREYENSGKLTLFASIAIVLVGGYFLNNSAKGLFEETYQKRLRLIENLENLNVPFCKIHEGKKFIFLISEDLSKAFYVDEKDDIHTLNASDIKAVSVVVDEKTVSKFTSGAGGSLAGAGIGGLVFGGAGALVGAVAGKNPKGIQESKITSLQIKLAVVKPGSNLIVLDFFKGEGAGFAKDDWVLTRPLKEMDEWWSTLTVMADSKS